MFADDTPSSMEDASPYSPRAFFLVAALFLAAAPVFWHRTEVRLDGIAAAYENADLYLDIYPAFSYGFGRLRAGDLPLWNSKQLCGTPFAANPARGVFQPLHVVFAVLDMPQAMAVHALLAMALAGVGFVLFMRALGAGYVASFFGAVCYAFCGASAASVSRPALAAALAWTPFLFWSIRSFARDFSYGGAILAGLFAGLTILSGAQALTVSMLIAAAAFALVHLRAGAARAPVKKRIEGIALMAATAIGATAIQWMPSLVWAWDLEQPARALWGAAPPGELPASTANLVAHLILPASGPQPRAAYVGVLPLLGIAAVLFRRKDHLLAGFFAVAAGLLLGCSSGAWPLRILPFSNAYLLYPGVFCLLVVASLGYDRLFTHVRSSYLPRVIGPAGIVALAAFAAFLVAPAAPRGRIVALFAVLVPLATFRTRWISVLCGTILAGIVFSDLTAAGPNLYMHPFENAPACYQVYAKTIRAAEEQALGARIAVSSGALDFGLPSNLGMIDPLLSSIGGQAPLTRDQSVWWRRLNPSDPASETSRQGPQIAPEAPAPRLVDYMAGRAILAAPGSPMYGGTWANGKTQLREIRTEDNMRMFIENAALPRAFWRPVWRMAESVSGAADVLVSDDFDAARECVVDRDSAGYALLPKTVPGPRDPVADPPPPLFANVEVALDDVDPEEPMLEVDAPVPGIVVLADTYARGWRATLDGAPCPVLRVNGLFRGVAVPAGGHTIRFEYRPIAFVLGAATSIATLAACALAGAVVSLRGRIVLEIALNSQ